MGIKARITLLMTGIRRRWLLNSLALSAVITLIGVTAYALVMAEYFNSGALGALTNRASATADYFSKYITDYGFYDENRSNLCC
jgi:hypothetical protein